jgi:hypothetical protein
MFGPPRLDPDAEPLAGSWYLAQESGVGGDHDLWVLVNANHGSWYRMVLEPIRRPTDLLRVIRGLGMRGESEPAHDVTFGLRALSIVFAPWENSSWDDPLPDGAVRRRCEELYQSRRQAQELRRLTR